VAGVSTAALQAAAAQSVAADRATGHRSDGSDEFTRAAIRWGVPLAVATLLASPLLARFLHSGLAPAACVGIYVLPAILLRIAMGRREGLEAFNKLALIAVGLALARLALAPLVLALGFGVTGVILVSVVLPLAVAFYAVWLSRDAGPIPLARVRGDVGRATA